MNYHDTSTQLAAWREEIAALRRRMREAQSAVVPEPVQDYEFATPDGSVHLSQMFGAKRDLFVIHNMGRACPHCTLWADGFNGIYRHIADRAGFVITSPDPPEVHSGFAAERGWRMPMASHRGSSFAADMGYRSAEGGWLPGVSVFRSDAGRLLRVADTGFQPADDFCPLWHLFDLLPGGAGDWQAKLTYN